MNDNYITPKQLAQELQVSMATLYRWRRVGIGPVWIKVCQGVRYRMSDVESWLASR